LFSDGFGVRFFGEIKEVVLVLVLCAALLRCPLSNAPLRYLLFQQQIRGDRERIAGVDVMVRRDHFSNHIGKIMIILFMEYQTREEKE